MGWSAAVMTDSKYLPTTLPIIITKDYPPNRYAQGYGRKIPTRFMVIDGRYKRRVYAHCFSNSASFYVLIKDRRVWLHDYHLEDARDAALKGA